MPRACLGFGPVLRVKPSALKLPAWRPTPCTASVWSPPTTLTSTLPCPTRLCHHPKSPPSTVRDLAVTAQTAKTITLSWTAPNGNGADQRATRYEMRRFPTRIQSLNWNDGTPVKVYRFPVRKAPAKRSWFQPQRRHNLFLRPESHGRRGPTFGHFKQRRRQHA